MSNVYEEKVKKFGLITYTTTRQQTKGVEEMLKNNSNQEELVTLRNVDITYGRGSKAFRAVVDLNLNIYKGEVLGLVGESGSGKSTIGKALVGLVPYSFGEIKLLGRKIPNKLTRGLKFGKKLKEYNEVVNFLVNKVQMIFQDPANSLNPHINVESVVSEGLTNTKNSKEIYLYNKDQEFQKQVYDLINEKKYPQFYGEYLDKLNNKIATNENVAFDAFYVDFLDDISNTKGLEKAVETLKELKTQREELSKLTENQCKRILVVEILKSVGLDESVLPRYPLEFSGGQQQRIGISRAVVLRPQLLVADEPISALDVSIQAQVVNIFNDLKDKYNLTILFIAHDLRMVEYISDRIAVMNKGRILEVGKTSEIMNNPLHPYTKSLLEAVPSIHGDKGSLLGYQYDINIHNYSETNQPEWLKVNDDHFILATNQELNNWKKGKYE
ncbi:ABC transporter ATP-binding protein [Mycoplasma anserisalpingitidis]|uniref:ABC transporter ATP-binding protein n=1 Tax=Mycoplasma anserisalpingitidis TaxID=519450 RepID=A0A5B8JAL3_9MOLU|nr:ABC transporter ATP-binding protein [Mycoplasma anserisalpingitidis]QDY88346.1 ABC transporter ATP-binding protein [Mycoplasma anserisalpingitidis]